MCWRYLISNLTEVSFNTYKFSAKDKPAKEDVLIICCFSEFGVEVVGSMYCIPRIIKENPNKYYIVVGWLGRDYLYRHLVDEFWELKEDFQGLRDFTYAFHHKNKILTKIEKKLREYGSVVPSHKLGEIAVGNNCKDCGFFWGQTANVNQCPKCKKQNLIKSLFANLPYWKSKAVRIPLPNKTKEAKQYIGENAVGITARNRSTYGRNLPKEFYEKLIDLLRKKGYNPVWLGEKQSTLECPDKTIPDLTRTNKDLELTLSIVQQCKFTVQFWTASTRLAGIMGVPYLLFESPDQLFGTGQEAYRLSLCTFGKRKLAICHYLNVLQDQDTAVRLVDRCIEEMEEDNWNDVIGMVDEPEYTASIRQQNLHRLIK